MYKPFIHFIEYNENNDSLSGDTMYNIGDRIVYPMHGAGIIEAIEEKLILGKTQNYYVLKIPLREMTVMIPVESAGDIGIRRIVTKSKADEVLDLLGCKKSTSNINWNKRYRENLLKIRSGDIFEVADVYKSLKLRDSEKGLSTGERKMLSTAKQILISELFLAEGTSIQEVEDSVSKCLGF